MSEGLYQELKPFGIRVKVIEPGIIHTNFYSAKDLTKDVHPAYKEAYERAKSSEKKRIDSGQFSEPIVVAKTIYKAATDKNWKLRYGAGKYAGTVLALRRILPDWLYLRFMGSVS